MRPAWEYEVRERADLLGVGEAVLRFDVPVKSGRADKVRVISNTGTETLAEIAVRVVTKANLPPMPPDVAAVLGGRPFQVENTFTVRP